MASFRMLAGEADGDARDRRASERERLRRPWDQLIEPDERE
jgi:hypothetical protein